MAYKILVADDSVTAQNLAKKILTDVGYEVIAVSNGAAAMKKIASDRPDLLILDVYMPGYTGLEVCEKVKSAPDTKSTPVLLTVAPMEPYNPDEGNRVKADGVIVKPFEARDLIPAIEKFQECAAGGEGRAETAHAARAAAAAAQGAPAAATPQVAVAAQEDWTEATPSSAPPIELPAEMAAAPAFAMEEIEADAPPSPTFDMEPAPSMQPAYPSAEAASFPASFPDTMTAVADQVSEFGVVSAPATELDMLPVAPEAVPEVAAPSFVMPEEPQQAAATEIAAAESAPAVEFNSAAAADPSLAAVDSVAEPELEVTSQFVDVSITQDPALVTDPADIMQFVTKFGADRDDNYDVPRDLQVAEVAESLPAVSEEMAQPAPGMPAEVAAPEEIAAPAQDDFDASASAPAQVCSETQELREERPATERAEASATEDAQPADAPPASVSEIEIAAAQTSSPEGKAEAAAEPAAIADTSIDHRLVAEFAAALQQADLSPQPELQQGETAANHGGKGDAPAEESDRAALDQEKVAQAVGRVLDRLRPEILQQIVRELSEHK